MKLDQISPASNADYLCLVDGLECYFSEFSGIDEKFKRPEFADGLSAKVRKAQTGSSMVEDCTLSVPFDPEIHAPVVAWIQARKDGSYFQASITPVIRSGELIKRGTKVFRLTNCRLMGWSAPGGVDTGGGDSVSKLSITFSVEEVTFS